MHILIAADIFPPQSGGPATYSVLLANELTKLGDSVKIVSLNPDSDKKVANCEVFPVSKKGKICKYFNYFWLLCKHIKNVDLVYAMGPVNAGLPALLISWWHKKKLAVKVVGDYAWEQGIQRFGVKESMDEFQQDNDYSFQVKILRWIEKFVTRNSDVVIVPSQYLKRIVLGWGVREKNVQVVYNSSNPINIISPEKTTNEKWITSAGRLVPWKGMDKLIEIMPDILIKFPEARLKIFGDGPEMKNLQAKVVDLKLEKFVELPGNLAHQNLLSKIKLSELFVLNSGYEGLSHLLLEALYCGTPILASRIGGNPELVISGKNGDLFELNNKEEIKAKILKMLANNHLNWEEKEKQVFFAQFSPDKMVRDTREVLVV